MIQFIITKLWKMKNRGALIVLEGGDHCGKTTQCEKLVSSINNRKGEGSAKCVQFPDKSSTIGSIINGYLGKKHDIDDSVIHLLFSANRWEKIEEMESLLCDGVTLIVDRYAYSGVAYTLAKTEFDIKWCKGPDVGLLRPDVVIYFTLSPEIAATRKGFGEDIYETSEFQERVNVSFEQLIEDNWESVDANKSIEDLHETLVNIADVVMETSKDKPLQRLWVPPSNKY